MDSLRSFGFLLKHASRLYSKRFEERARSIRLTLPQCKALVYLARNEGMSQVQLAEAADIEPMTLVRILDRMEADGWVERRNDPADRRARRLFLTVRAKPLLQAIDRLSVEIRDEAFLGITPREAESLVAALEKVCGNLVTLEPLHEG